LFLVPGEPTPREKKKGIKKVHKVKKGAARRPTFYRGILRRLLYYGVPPKSPQKVTKTESKTPAGWKASPLLFLFRRKRPSVLKRTHQVGERSRGEKASRIGKGEVLTFSNPLRTGGGGGETRGSRGRSRSSSLGGGKAVVCGISDGELDERCQGLNSMKKAFLGRRGARPKGNGSVKKKPWGRHAFATQRLEQTERWGGCQGNS